MNIRKKNLSPKFLSPLRICLVGMFSLASALVWQYLLLNRKDHAIVLLLNENAELKKNLLSIDSDLLEIKDTASDVRLFQKELIKVIKDIDQNYPVSFASRPKSKPSCAFDEVLEYDAQAIVKNAHESIFKLSSSQHKLRFDTASLLGRAVSIRDILATTPSMIPVSDGYVSSDFGIRTDPITGKIKHHNGVDIAAPIGTSVLAAADGSAIKVGKNPSFGNMIELSHNDGFTSTYAHLSEILVKKGDTVKRGQEIGRVGNTGSSVGAHLHYSISKNGRVQNPKPYMIMTPPVIF